MNRRNVHFVFLAIGSAAFLYWFFGVKVLGGGDRTLLEVWALSHRLKILAYYAVFVSLVIGHGVLRGSTKDGGDSA